MAHKSSKIFDIPHGCANAIYLPVVIEFNAKIAGDKYADVSKRLALSGTTNEELANSLITYINELFKKTCYGA